MTRIVSTTGDGGALAREELERAIGSGGVAVFPSDGLYGLACDPTSPAAAARVHELKGRDEGKSSAVMYFTPLAMREVLVALDDATREALAALMPGPVTAVVRNPERRYPLACREDPERLGLRLIEGPLAGTRVCVLQTSANLSGEPAPARLDDVPERVVEGCDLAIDGGELGGEPSTVVDLTELSSDGGWRVLRRGAMPEAALKARLGGRA